MTGCCGARKSTSRGGKRGRGAAFVTGAVSGLSVVAVGALVAHEVSWSWQWLIVLAALSHYAMWTAPLALIVAVIARRWRTAAVGALASVLVVVIQLPAVVAPAPTNGRPLVVLQANLKVGGADPNALVDLVRRHHVDVLATEELTVAEERRLIAAGLPRLLPYRFTAPLPDGGGGLGMWSRFPISDEHNLPGYELGVLTAHLNAHGHDVTFVAVHLLPPYPYPSGIWRHEIGSLGTMLDRLPGRGPVIVAGDFNATVDHAQFRALLHDRFEDAASATGAGYLPTYPNDRWWGPVIAIDHVLERGPVYPDSVSTLDVPGSDHRALLVRTYLPE